MGRSRFNISCSNALISTWAILISVAALSIFTRDSKSSIILLSLSISSEISIINSRYSSTGTSSIPISESASTRMDVIGVFSSWDTLDTNSSLDWSTVFSLVSVVVTADDISLVSL